MSIGIDLVLGLSFATMQIIVLYLGDLLLIQLGLTLGLGLAIIFAIIAILIPLVFILESKQKEKLQC